jgi:hypothetical protein
LPDGPVQRALRAVTVGNLYSTGLLGRVLRLLAVSAAISASGWLT